MRALLALSLLLPRLALAAVTCDTTSLFHNYGDGGITSWYDATLAVTTTDARILVVLGQTHYNGGTPVSTASGGGLTWHKIQEHVSTASPGDASAFWAYSADPISNTTISVTWNSPQYRVLATLYACTGADSVDPIGAATATQTAASVPADIAISATGTGSLVVASSFNGDGTPTFRGDTSTAYSYSNGTTRTLWTVYSSTTTSGPGAVTLGTTAPTLTSGASIQALEIRAGTAGATTCFAGMGFWGCQ